MPLAAAAVPQDKDGSCELARLLGEDLKGSSAQHLSDVPGWQKRLMEELDAALKAGGFEARSSLGQRLGHLLSPQEKREYGTLDNAAKARFRLDWAAPSLQEAKDKWARSEVCGGRGHRDRRVPPSNGPIPARGRLRFRGQRPGGVVLCQVPRHAGQVGRLDRHDGAPGVPLR